jgi:hypothetical protein
MYCNIYSSYCVSYPITGLDRPLGFQEVEASRISKQLGHERGKVESRPYGPPLSPGDITGSHFC